MRERKGGSAMAERKRSSWKFDSAEYARKRPVAWNAEEGKAIYHDDLLGKDGKVAEGECKALGIDPGSVRPFTFADLGADYSTLAKAVATAVKVNGAASADDLIYSLIVEDAMQRQINAMVSAIRPVTDKAATRATNVLIKVLREKGKSDAEINAALSALGMK